MPNQLSSPYFHNCVSTPASQPQEAHRIGLSAHMSACLVRVRSGPQSKDQRKEAAGSEFVDKDWIWEENIYSIFSFKNIAKLNFKSSSRQVQFQLGLCVFYFQLIQQPSQLDFYRRLIQTKKFVWQLIIIDIALSQIIFFCLGQAQLVELFL